MPKVLKASAAPRAIPRPVMERTSDMPCWSDRLQFGGDTFVAAYELLRRHPSGATAWRLTPRRGDLTGLVAMFALLRDLPRLPVRTTDSPAGLRIRAHLNVREWGLIRSNRVAQGVLLVPRTIAEYLRGRHRQAVRTNLHRARRAGFSCRAVEDVAERRWMLTRWNENASMPECAVHFRVWIDRCDEAGRQWMTAFDTAGEPLGFAVMTVDTECALLEFLCSSSHTARWLLNASVVETLCHAGVRYLLTTPGSALRVGPNTQYVQRLLGYRVAHLCVQR